MSHVIERARMEFSLELARLRGTESLQNCVSPLDDELQFLRFLAGSSERLGWCIYQAAASRSFYRSNCSEQWLLTVLKSQDIAPMSDISIQSNVVPSCAYLSRLEGVRATCRGHQCTGGFVLTSDIGPALEGQLPHGTEIHASCETGGGEGQSVSQCRQSKISKYQSCTNCALAEQLSMRLNGRIAVTELENLLKLWFLEVKDVKSVRDIYGGADGDVSTILWRDGIFARKRFRCDDDLRLKFKNLKFNRELDVALSISHPNIVHCFGCSSDCDLFMEFLDEDLESFLSRSAEMKPPFSLREALEMLLQVAEAVNHLHDNSFIHGDLKPGNILMSQLAMPHTNVPFHLVKVADFGCAQRFGAATRQKFDVDIGNLRYLAPEVKQCRRLLNDEKRLNRKKLLTKEELLKQKELLKKLQEAVQRIDPPKVDVFSFGVVANEVIANVLVGPSSDGAHLASLNSFLLRCEDPEPRERPSFVEIRETLIMFNAEGLSKKGGTLTRFL